MNQANKENIYIYIYVWYKKHLNEGINFRTDERICSNDDDKRWTGYGDTRFYLIFSFTSFKYTNSRIELNCVKPTNFLI